MSSDEEKLGKVVRLAKDGSGGERDAAIRIVKKLCKKMGLSFADVMSDEQKMKVYEVECSKKSVHLVMHIIMKYVYDGDGRKENISFYENRYTKKHILEFETTPDRYIETVNAIDVLTKLYKKEEKRMRDVLKFGFFEKHGLFVKHVKKEEEKTPSAEELKNRMMGSRIASNMEDSNLTKRLVSGK